MGKTYEARGGKFGCKGVNEVEWGGRKVGGRIYSATPEYCWRTRSLVASNVELLLAARIRGTPAVSGGRWRTE